MPGDDAGVAFGGVAKRVVVEMGIDGGGPVPSMTKQLADLRQSLARHDCQTCSRVAQVMQTQPDHQPAQVAASGSSPRSSAAFQTRESTSTIRLAIDGVARSTWCSAATFAVIGTILLLLRCPRLLGRYDSRVAFGQERPLVVWHRLILPDGVSVVVENLPAADQAGYVAENRRTP